VGSRKKPSSAHHELPEEEEMKSLNGQRDFGEFLESSPSVLAKKVWCSVSVRRSLLLDLVLLL